MTVSSRAEEYAALSRGYMRQAEAELEQEDYLQAGEKAWGAVATAIKAIAEQRGWNHTHHDLTGDALMWLADEFARQDLKDRFALTELLHRNFYEDKMTEPEVERRVEGAKTLLGELEHVRSAPPRMFIPTSNRQKRRWERLTGEKWDDTQNP